MPPRLIRIRIGSDHHRVTEHTEEEGSRIEDKTRSCRSRSGKNMPLCLCVSVVIRNPKADHSTSITTKRSMILAAWALARAGAHARLFSATFATFGLLQAACAAAPAGTAGRLPAFHPNIATASRKGWA